MVEVTGNKAFKHFLVVTFFKFSIQHGFDVCTPGIQINHLTANADNFHVIRQTAQQVEPEQTRIQFNAGQVAACAKQYQGAWINFIRHF